jgi:signal transduction histidine kinase
MKNYLKKHQSVFNFLQNKAKRTPYFVVFFIALIVEAIFGYIDWITNNHVPFTIFYILPIFMIVFHKESGSFSLIFISALAAIIWGMVYLPKNETVFVIFNSLLRLGVFLLIAFVTKLLIVQRATLTEQNEKLSLINQEKNRILGIASHDIRNGIGAINSFSGLIIQNTESAKRSNLTKEYIHIIKQESENLLLLLDNLLDISQLDTGTTKLNLQNNNYLDLLTQRLVVFRLLAINKEIEIELDFQLDAPIIRLDKLYLQSAIDNLISNAIKYSYPKSTVKITVYKTKWHIFTEIKDSGVGIPEAEAHKIFLPFSKTRSKPTAGEQSRGLGLAIVKRIIELHDGTINFYGIPAKGTTFFFTLPIN